MDFLKIWMDLFNSLVEQVVMEEWLWFCYFLMVNSVENWMKYVNMFNDMFKFYFKGRK